jgi:DNA-binding protein HU-beta
MTKDELCEKLAFKASLPSKAAAAKALEAIVGCIQESLVQGDGVTLTGFGSFSVVERAARIGRNPSTGAEMTIPAAKKVKFTPGKFLKDAVN